MRALHVVTSSLPRAAGYAARTQAIREHQAALGIEPLSEFLPQGRLGAAPLVGVSVEMAALAHRLVQIHRETAVDVIHAHSPVLCGIPAHAAARRLGLPSVYEIRAFWEDAAESQGKGGVTSTRYAVTRGTETSLCRLVDSVVAISKGIRRDLIARGLPPEKIFVIPNGVYADRLRPREARLELVERLGFQGKIVIAYVGALLRVEGVSLLLQALVRMIAVNDQVRGLIVGDGGAGPELRALHAQLGLGDRVVLTGEVPPAEVPSHYALADVLCYPRERRRITELTPPSMPLEAMSMSKAVVASDVGGHQELIRDRETGLLFRAGDEDDLVRVLTRAARDRDLRRALGERARAAMIAERSWPTLVRRYLVVYEAARAEGLRRARDRVAAAV